MPNCRACRSGRLYMFLSLGDQPPANAFLSRDQLALAEARWPLDPQVCLDCGLIQIPNVLRADFFRDYVYVPSASDTLHHHFAGLAAVVRKNLARGSNDLVVDIGSNDGLFLWKLKCGGGRGLGIEPAENLAHVARDRGVEVVTEYFTANIARDVRENHGAALVVTATNTFNHIDDLHGFMAAVMVLLDSAGTFIVEVPYAGDLIENNEFDTIYHEHVSEFTVKSIVDLFACFDLVVVDIVRLAVHGGSMRVFGRRRNAGAVPSSAVAEWLSAEQRVGLFDVATYDAFAERVQVIKERTLALLETLTADGRRIAGYGASAKGNTLLNYYGIGADTLPYLADRNPLKRGLFSPGMHIPVVRVERVLEEQPDYLLLLAWSSKVEVMRQQKEYRRRGGTFIVPVPEPRVIA
ncbi:MAG TPA: class I SAM-dependent methyltransferase [Vicinamibacterales bacterium]|nr:class I SAM-dependent methyltransferase [Vicinamibacterales bacterium]